MRVLEVSRCCPRYEGHEARHCDETLAEILGGGAERIEWLSAEILLD